MSRRLNPAWIHISQDPAPESRKRTWVMVGNRWIRNTAEFAANQPGSGSAEASKVVEALKPFDLSDDTLRGIKDLMLKDMLKGLGADTHPDAIIKMYPTYVRSTPDGTEKGDFLALDLGGSNFRVLMVKLDGSQFDIKSKKFSMDKSVMTGTGDELFDYIAACIAEFLEEHGLTGQKFPLGFTFSFPCKQEGLNKGVLTTWTKGFSASGVVGENVVQLLHAACKRRQDLSLDVVALVNDTTGTMMSCGHSERDCGVGLIVGTGTNACYMEKLENVELWDGDMVDPKQVIINMEWGAFGSDGTLEHVRTDYDRQVDSNTPNKGKQLYEKLISGMYLGEIARRVLVKLANDSILFGGRVPELLNTPWKFDTAFITNIEEGGETKCREILEGLGLSNVTSEECFSVYSVCEAISTRAARLAGAGIACVVSRMARSQVTVGVDGSVYKFHPTFKDVMADTTKLLAPEVNTRFMLSEDGSGKGAALIAAVAARMQSGGSN